MHAWNLTLVLPVFCLPSRLFFFFHPKQGMHEINGSHTKFKLFLVLMERTRKKCNQATLCLIHASEARSPGT